MVNEDVGFEDALLDLLFLRRPIKFKASVQEEASAANGVPLSFYLPLAVFGVCGLVAWAIYLLIVKLEDCYGADISLQAHLSETLKEKSDEYFSYYPSLPLLWERKNHSVDGEETDKVNSSRIPPAPPPSLATPDLATEPPTIVKFTHHKDYVQSSPGRPKFWCQYICSPTLVDTMRQECKKQDFPKESKRLRGSHDDLLEQVGQCDKVSQLSSQSAHILTSPTKAKERNRGAVDGTDTGVNVRKNTSDSTICMKSKDVDNVQNVQRFLKEDKIETSEGVVAEAAVKDVQRSRSRRDRSRQTLKTPETTDFVAIDNFTEVTCLNAVVPVNKDCRGSSSRMTTSSSTSPSDDGNSWLVKDNPRKSLQLNSTWKNVVRKETSRAKPRLWLRSQPKAMKGIHKMGRLADALLTGSLLTNDKKLDNVFSSTRTASYGRKKQDSFAIPFFNGKRPKGGVQEISNDKMALRNRVQDIPDGRKTPRNRVQDIPDGRITPRTRVQNTPSGRITPRNRKQNIPDGMKTPQSRVKDTPNGRITSRSRVQNIPDGRTTPQSRVKDIFHGRTRSQNRVQDVSDSSYFRDNVQRELRNQSLSARNTRQAHPNNQLRGMRFNSYGDYSEQSVATNSASNNAYSHTPQRVPIVTNNVTNGFRPSSRQTWATPVLGIETKLENGKATRYGIIMNNCSRYENKSSNMMRKPRKAKETAKTISEALVNPPTTNNLWHKPRQQFVDNSCHDLTSGIGFQRPNNITHNLGSRNKVVRVEDDQYYQASERMRNRNSVHQQQYHLVAQHNFSLHKNNRNIFKNFQLRLPHGEYLVQQMGRRVKELHKLYRRRRFHLYDSATGGQPIRHSRIQCRYSPYGMLVSMPYSKSYLTDGIKHNSLSAVHGKCSELDEVYVTQDQDTPTGFFSPGQLGPYASQHSHNFTNPYMSWTMHDDLFQAAQNVGEIEAPVRREHNSLSHMTHWRGTKTHENHMPCTWNQRPVYSSMASSIGRTNKFFNESEASYRMPYDSDTSRSRLLPMRPEIKSVDVMRSIADLSDDDTRVPSLEISDISICVSGSGVCPINRKETVLSHTAGDGFCQEPRGTPFEAGDKPVYSTSKSVSNSPPVCWFRHRNKACLLKKQDGPAVRERVRSPEVKKEKISKISPIQKKRCNLTKTDTEPERGKSGHSPASKSKGRRAGIVKNKSLLPSPTKAFPGREDIGWQVNAADTKKESHQRSNFNLKIDSKVDKNCDQEIPCSNKSEEKDRNGAGGEMKPLDPSGTPSPGYVSRIVRAHAHRYKSKKIHMELSPCINMTDKHKPKTFVPSSPSLSPSDNTHRKRDKDRNYRQTKSRQENKKMKKSPHFSPLLPQTSFSKTTPCLKACVSSPLAAKKTKSSIYSTPSAASEIERQETQSVENKHKQSETEASSPNSWLIKFPREPVLKVTLDTLSNSPYGQISCGTQSHILKGGETTGQTKNLPIDAIHNEEEKLCDAYSLCPPTQTTILSTKCKEANKAASDVFKQQRSNKPTKSGKISRRNSFYALSSSPTTNQSTNPPRARSVTPSPQKSTVEHPIVWDTSVDQEVSENNPRPRRNCDLNSTSLSLLSLGKDNLNGSDTMPSLEPCNKQRASSKDIRSKEGSSTKTKSPSPGGMSTRSHLDSDLSSSNVRKEIMKSRRQALLSQTKRTQSNPTVSTPNTLNKNLKRFKPWMRRDVKQKCTLNMKGSEVSRKQIGEEIKGSVEKVTFGKSDEKKQAQNENRCRNMRISAPNKTNKLNTMLTPNKVITGDVVVGNKDKAVLARPMPPGYHTSMRAKKRSMLWQREKEPCLETKSRRTEDGSEEFQLRDSHTTEPLPQPENVFSSIHEAFQEQRNTSIEKVCTLTALEELNSPQHKAKERKTRSSSGNTPASNFLGISPNPNSTDDYNLVSWQKGSAISSLHKEVTFSKSASPGSPSTSSKTTKDKFYVKEDTRKSPRFERSGQSPSCAEPTIRARSQRDQARGQSLSPRTQYPFWDKRRFQKQGDAKKRLKTTGEKDRSGEMISKTSAAGDDMVHVDPSEENTRLNSRSNKCADRRIPPAQHGGISPSTLHTGGREKHSTRPLKHTRNKVSNVAMYRFHIKSDHGDPEKTMSSKVGKQTSFNKYKSESQSTSGAEKDSTHTRDWRALARQTCGAVPQGKALGTNNSAAVLPWWCHVGPGDRMLVVRLPPKRMYHRRPGVRRVSQRNNCAALATKASFQTWVSGLNGEGDGNRSMQDWKDERSETGAESAQFSPTRNAGNGLNDTRHGGSNENGSKLVERTPGSFDWYKPAARILRRRRFSRHRQISGQTCRPHTPFFPSVSPLTPSNPFMYSCIAHQTTPSNAGIYNGDISQGTSNNVETQRGQASELSQESGHTNGSPVCLDKHHSIIKSSSCPNIFSLAHSNQEKSESITETVNQAKSKLHHTQDCVFKTDESSSPRSNDETESNAECCSDISKIPQCVSHAYSNMDNCTFQNLETLIVSPACLILDVQDDSNRSTTVDQNENNRQTPNNATEHGPDMTETNHPRPTDLLVGVYLQGSGDLEHGPDMTETNHPRPTDSLVGVYLQGSGDLLFMLEKGDIPQVSED